MKKQTRLFISVIIFAVLLIGAAQFFLKNQNKSILPVLQTRDVNQPAGKTVFPTSPAKLESVNIDFGNGKNITGQVYVQTAYQALVQLAKTNNMAVSAKEYKYGKMVTKVGDIEGSSGSAWMYWVNGQPGQVAADRYVVHPGDTIDWKLTKLK